MLYEVGTKSVCEYCSHKHSLAGLSSTAELLFLLLSTVDEMIQSLPGCVLLFELFRIIKGVYLFGGSLCIFLAKSGQLCNLSNIHDRNIESFSDYPRHNLRRESAILLLTSSEAHTVKYSKL